MRMGHSGSLDDWRDVGLRIYSLHGHEQQRRTQVLHQSQEKDANSLYEYLGLTSRTF